jgi:GT2 family glycosyltransferase
MSHVAHPHPSIWKKTTLASVVVLTQGGRPAELSRCLESVLAQDFPTEVILVVNGGTLDLELDQRISVVELDENRGVAGGRNIGAGMAAGEIVMFLDDDAWIASSETVRTIASLFDSRPQVGIVGCRLTDPETGRSLRRWIPRLRKSNASPGPVATFPGGASFVRTALFEGLGGFPPDFVYSFEETDLAWRAIAAGWDVWFEPQAVVHHPATRLARHPSGCRLSSRNRVIVARRQLPRVLWPFYIGAGLVRSAIQRCLREGMQGVTEGFRWEPIERIPMGWASVARLTRLGRPPIV